MSIIYNNQVIAGKYREQIINEADTINAGIIKIATQQEVEQGESNTSAVTPYYLSTKQDKLIAGDGIIIDENLVECTIYPDEETIIQNDNGTINCIGQLTKSNTIKFDWEGTEAEYTDAMLNGIIQPNWYCYITDDEVIVDYGDVANQSLNNLKPEGEKRFADKANINLDNLSEEGNSKFDNKVNIDLSNISQDGINIIKNNSGGGLEIGDIGIAPLGIDETKGKRRYLNGQLIIQEQYVQFTNKVKSAIALYPSLACTESEWQTTATMTVGGQVGKFVVDNEAGTIRLPKITMPIQGLTDLSKLGEIVEAGLPNITGTIINMYGGGLFAGDGAFETTTGVNFARGSSSGGSSEGNANFDASLSNAIYGNSDTVQQEQIQYPYFIQVATGAETEDNIINELELVTPYVLLEPKFFETEVYNSSWLATGGFTGSKAVHPSAYNALLIELNTDIEVGTTVDNYTKRGLSVKLFTDEYTDYDFVINSADETFRPPLKVKIASGKAVVGNGIGLGVVNSVGVERTLEWGSQNDQSLWTLPVTDRTGFTYINTGDPVKVSTDPTKSGIETSDNDLHLYFYVGAVTQNAPIVNTGRVEEKISQLLAKPHIVDTYVNGTSGYNVYSNKWCEQWGETPKTNPDAHQVITFLKPFANTDYYFNRSCLINNSSGTSTGYFTGYFNKTATSVTIQSSTYTDKTSWFASGYIA